MQFPEVNKRKEEFKLGKAVQGEAMVNIPRNEYLRNSDLGVGIWTQFKCSTKLPSTVTISHTLPLSK